MQLSPDNNRMRFRIPILIFVLGVLFLFPLNGWGASVQKKINKRISEQSKKKEGAYFRSLLPAGDYQDSADVLKSRSRLSFERRREEAANALISRGPIVLDDLLAFSLEFNDRILADRAGLRAVQGEKLVELSRFLPHVSFVYRGSEHDSGFTGTSGRAENQSLKLTQRLLEFGRESDSSVAFRASQRRALFAYEETVGLVLKNVRIKFFTILLWQEQIKERQVLLREYQDRYEKMQELEKVRRVLEVDVLTSRLNVLHEEARINSLEKELYRQKIDLQAFAGFPVGPLEFTLQGEIVPLRCGMEQCVDIGLRRSTSVAQARADQYEQQRVSNRAWWEHGPNVNLDFKWKRDGSSAGVAVDRDNGTYQVLGFAEKYLKGPDSALTPNDPFYAFDNQGWRVDVVAEFPIFQGFGAVGRQKREWALLDYSTFSLRRTVDSIELTVRKAYQNMLEQEKGLEILKETATISRERLKIQESLKELGKISDNELETFRNRFFDDQSEYYNAEIGWIVTQEELRYAMRWFEPETFNEGR